MNHTLTIVLIIFVASLTACSVESGPEGGNTKTVPLFIREMPDDQKREAKKIEKLVKEASDLAASDNDLGIDKVVSDFIDVHIRWTEFKNWTAMAESVKKAVNFPPGPNQYFTGGIRNLKPSSFYCCVASFRSPDHDKLNARVVLYDPDEKFKELMGRIREGHALRFSGKPAKMSIIPKHYDIRTTHKIGPDRATIFIYLEQLEIIKSADN